MSGGKGGACLVRDHRWNRLRHWRVTSRHAHHSAFAGGRRTRSRYSEVECITCPASWRTDADYVSELPDAPGAGA